MGHTATADPSETLACSPSISWPQLPNPQPLSCRYLMSCLKGPIVDQLLTIQLCSASAKGQTGHPWVHLPPLLPLPIRHAIALVMVEVDASGAEFYKDNVGVGGVGRTKEPCILSSWSDSPSSLKSLGWESTDFWLSNSCTPVLLKEMPTHGPITSPHRNWE